MTRWTIGCSALALVGCGDWFNDGRACTEGETSCDGRAIRLCVPKVDEAAGANGVKTSWRVTGSCEDDPFSGRQTCGLVDGVAACVTRQVDEDAGASPGPETQWQRVDVRREGDAFALETSPHYLRAAPLAASSGAVAAVAYAGDKPLDAALVRFLGEASRSVAWVRAEAATRVVLVDVAGRELAHAPVDAMGETDSELVASKAQYLGPSLPPTLRVRTPSSDLSVPSQWADEVDHVVAPDALTLEFLAEALGDLPLPLSSAITELAFAAAEDDDQDAGAEMLDAGVEPVALDSDEWRLQYVTLLEGNRLWMNASAPVREALGNEQWRRELAVDVVRHAGRAFAALASTASSSDSPAEKRPEDFPSAIAALLESRITPMLGRGESFATAWRGLHDMGVSAGIAGAYVSAPSQPRSDVEAVASGFSSAAGAVSPELDFADYTARANVDGSWSAGPCAEIRGEKLDELAPRLLVPVAKLHVLWGLGVLSHERFVACVGDLQVASNKPGFALHKSNGEQVAVADELAGVRAPYLRGEIHVSAMASRDGIHAVLDVTYRGVMPDVIRLKPVVNTRSESFGATLALTSNVDAATSPAEAGLVVVTSVTRQSIEARALMVQLAEPMFGTRIFPLVTLRVQQPLWPDAP
jgi:hypothetical protein